MARRQRQNPVCIASPLLPSPPESSPPHRRAGAVKPENGISNDSTPNEGRHNLSQQVSRKQAIHICRLSARLIQTFLHRLALQFTLRLLPRLFPKRRIRLHPVKNLPAIIRLPSAPMIDAADVMMGGCSNWMLDLPACIKFLLKHKNIVKNILFKLSLQSQYLHKHTFLCFQVICIPRRLHSPVFTILLILHRRQFLSQLLRYPGTNRLPSAV